MVFAETLLSSGFF